MRSAYDPFNREEELEQERIAGSRAEHELWSLDQARKGQSAAQRENVGTWVRLGPHVPEETAPPASPAPSKELAAWAQ